MRWAAAAFVLIVPSSPAISQSLWGSASVGDSAARVQEKFPKAFVPDAAERNLMRLANYADCRLQLSGYQLGIVDFKICFYFIHDSLIQVTLKPQKPLYGAPAGPVFKAALAALHVSLGRGEGESQESEDGAVSRGGYYTRWKGEGIKISILFYYNGEDRPSTLNINYQWQDAPLAPPPPPIGGRSIGPNMAPKKRVY